MFQTAFTLNLTHFARLLSLPERLQHTPVRNLSLEPLRQRNTTVDAFFYDIKVVTPDEAFYISDSLAAVGSILIVPPSGAGPLTLCDTLDEFFMRGGCDVHVLAIAGAGGSALGAAAFARNVADAVGEPVATVVPGYGLADAIGEAMGGSFLFGWLNQIRHGFDVVDTLFGRPQFGVDPDTNIAAASARNSCRDMQTVMALLADPRLRLRLLTGHSKGNLVLSEALTRLSAVDADRVPQIAGEARIVTFGARLAMPEVFTDVVAAIGEWDWFGELNSRPSAATDLKVKGAWHHTNTDIPGHVSVTSVLKDILETPAMKSPQPEPEPEPSVLPQAAAADEVTGASTPPAAVAAIEEIVTAVSQEIVDTDQASSEPVPAVANVEVIRKAKTTGKPKPAASSLDAETEIAELSPPPAARRRKSTARNRQN